MNKNKRDISIFTWSIIKPAIKQAFVKLNPVYLVKNPVMFSVEIIALLTTVIFFRDCLHPAIESPFFTGQITLWLWFTALFGNFAESVAEGKGKAQAAMLRKTKQELKAKLLLNESSSEYKMVPASELKIGSIVLVETGDTIPGDGDVIQRFFIYNIF